MGETEVDHDSEATDTTSETAVGPGANATTADDGDGSGGGDDDSQGGDDPKGETGGQGDSGGQTESSSGAPPVPGCGDGNVDPDEQCDDGNDNPFDGCLPDCTATELLDPPALEWTYFETEGTQCLDGSTAGFAVNYNPDSPNVMIYLEGGGACFSDACDFTAFNLPFIPPVDGVFSRSNDANPVSDWTMIYVPYCTGDIHAGDNEMELGGSMRQFRGYSNITRYLQQWVPSFEAETVLLTGISAGGFGAALNAAHVADAYGDDVQMVMIDDSGPPMSNDVMPPCLQETFRETWNLDNTVLAGCPTCDSDDFARSLLDDLLTNYPTMRIGLYSNMADTVIRTYMGAGWGNGQYDNCDGLPVPVGMLTYSNDLIATRALNEEHVSTFFRIGLDHTILRLLAFDWTFVDGVLFTEWMGAVIDGDTMHVGP